MMWSFSRKSAKIFNFVFSFLQEVFQINVEKDGIVATSVCRKDTGIRAVMNSSTFHDGRNHVLATGEDELCHTYSVKYKVVKENSSAGIHLYVFVLQIERKR